jgi:hypothetical protein
VAHYDSFLLQVWRSNRREGRQLAARLEHLQDGQRVQCAGLDALLAHLRDVLDGGPIASAGQDEDVAPEC